MAKPFRPWEGREPWKTRHVFQESACFFVTGFMVQFDKWYKKYWRIPGMGVLLSFLSWHADELRMRLADHPLNR